MNVASLLRASFGLLGMLGASGCARAPAPNVPQRHWVPAYVLGIWGKGELDVRDDCPTTGAASVFIGPTWQTILVSVGTVGLYTPREVRVYCRAAR